MAIDYEKLRSKLADGVWYTGDELSQVWRLPHLERKARANAMCHRGLLTRRGKTIAVQYKVATNKDAKPNKVAAVKELPTNSLDSLIAAASKVGTENEILKTALKEAKAAIERAFEAIK